jgi:hypothetical protein
MLPELVGTDRSLGRGQQNIPDEARDEVAERDAAVRAPRDIHFDPAHGVANGIGIELQRPAHCAA